MNRRATLAEANERRGMAIVVALDVGRIESRESPRHHVHVVHDDPRSPGVKMLEPSSKPIGDRVSALRGAISTAARAQPSISMR